MPDWVISSAVASGIDELQATTSSSVFVDRKYSGQSTLAESLACQLKLSSVDRIRSAYARYWDDGPEEVHEHFTLA